MVEWGAFRLSKIRKKYFMKKLIFGFTMVISMIFVSVAHCAQISVSGLLSIHVDYIEIAPGSLQSRVSQVIRKVAQQYPEIYGVNVTIEGAHLNAENQAPLLKLKDRTLLEVLEFLLADMAKGFRVELVGYSLVIYEPRLEPETERLFVIPDRLAQRIGVIWDTPDELVKSIEALGFLGRITDVDIERRIFKAVSSKKRILILENIILLGDLLPDQLNIKIMEAGPQ